MGRATQAELAAASKGGVKLHYGRSVHCIRDAHISGKVSWKRDHACKEFQRTENAAAGGKGGGRQGTLYHSALPHAWPLPHKRREDQGLRSGQLATPTYRHPDTVSAALPWMLQRTRPREPSFLGKRRRRLSRTGAPGPRPET